MEYFLSKKRFRNVLLNFARLKEQSFRVLTRLLCVRNIQINIFR